MFRFIRGKIFCESITTILIRTSNQRILLVFRLHRKKEAWKSRDPAMLHRYSCYPPKDSRPHWGWASRTEFLTTARILSFAGQLVVGISRERIDFSSPAVSFAVANDAFRFRSYPSTSLCRLIFCSVLLRFLFLLFHDFHHIYPVL